MFLLHCDFICFHRVCCSVGDLKEIISVHSHDKGVEDQNLVDKAAAATRGSKQATGRRANVRVAGKETSAH